MINNIMVRLVAKVKGIEVCCVNCYTLASIGDFESKSDDATNYVTTENFVSKDYVCEECGCNTFTLDAFVEVKLESQ